MRARCMRRIWLSPRDMSGIGWGWYSCPRLTPCRRGLACETCRGRRDCNDATESRCAEGCKGRSYQLQWLPVPHDGNVFTCKCRFLCIERSVDSEQACSPDTLPLPYSASATGRSRFKPCEGKLHRANLYGAAVITVGFPPVSGCLAEDPCHQLSCSGEAKTRSTLRSVELVSST